jgi:hypothetical protein
MHHRIALIWIYIGPNAGSCKEGLEYDSFLLISHQFFFVLASDIEDPETAG